MPLSLPGCAARRQCGSHHWRKIAIEKRCLVENPWMGCMERPRTTRHAQSRGGARGCGPVLGEAPNRSTCPDGGIATLSCAAMRRRVTSRGGAAWLVASMHSEQCSGRMLVSRSPGESGVSAKASLCGSRLVHISTESTSVVRIQPRDGVGAMAPSTATSKANHIAQGWCGRCVRYFMAAVVFSAWPEPGV